MRKQIPEPVFGVIKSVMGFRQFLLRGLDCVQGEWSLVTMAWNMRRCNVDRRLRRWLSRRARRQPDIHPNRIRPIETNNINNGPPQCSTPLSDIQTSSPKPDRLLAQDRLALRDFSRAGGRGSARGHHLAEAGRDRPAPPHLRALAAPPGIGPPAPAARTPG